MQMKQKVVSLALAGLLALPQVSFARSFHDVTRTNHASWAYDAIDHLSNINILNGFPDGTFKPNHPVSFLETMQIIKGLMQPAQEVLNNAVSTYGPYVKEQGVEPWAQEAVAFNLYINTITKNTLEAAKKGGFLRVNNPVYPSRNSIAVYMGRALRIEQNKSTSLLQYKDMNKIPVITLNYLPGLVETKIFTPTGSEGNFNGGHYIRRSEMAIISKQTLEYLKAKPAPYAAGNLLDGVDAPVEGTQGAPSGLPLPDSSANPPAAPQQSNNNALPQNQTSSAPSGEVKEAVHFQGQIKNIINGGSVFYLEVLITQSDNPKFQMGQTITVNTSKHYRIGDVVHGEGNMGERNLLDIKLN